MSQESWVTLERSGRGWAKITLAREPVNSMDRSFWQQLTDVVESCEQADDIRGVIFCSGLKRPVFTAGNDLQELYAPATTRQRYKLFWRVSNQFLARLYVSPLLTVCAIRGACPAGGCCLALCCDYRIMTDFGSIGLNEVELGIPVPKFWAMLLGRVTTMGVADKLSCFAQMLSPSQALAAGLLDEVVPAARLMPAAEEAMESMLKLPDEGRIATKRSLRGAFAGEWEGYLDQESESGFSMLQLPETVNSLKGVFERLASKRNSRL